MTVTTKENAVSTPAKFEVGKRYRTFPHKFGMVTVLKRNKTTIDFCLSGNESKVIRRKFFADSVYAHDAESVSYGQHENHFWFVAKDVVDELEQAAGAVAEIDNNVGNLTDSALAASNSRLAAFHMNDAVTEIDVSEYAITEDAFNFAVEQEIEDAEQAAYEARVTARILADDNLAARYEKAKSQVKCERYESGWRSWFFKGKNRTEWELNATKAAACLTRYGLSICEFVILHDAEVAVIESNGFDETAFDFLPNFEDDELRDYLYDFDERQQLLEDKYEPKTAADTVTEITKAEKIAALERTIAYVMSERDEAHEELAKAEVDDEISQDAIDKKKKTSIITVVEFINCFYNLGGGNFGSVSREHQMGRANQLARRYERQHFVKDNQRIEPRRNKQRSR